MIPASFPCFVAINTIYLSGSVPQILFPKDIKQTPFKIVAV